MGLQSLIKCPKCDSQKIKCLSPFYARRKGEGQPYPRGKDNDLYSYDCLDCGHSWKAQSSL